MLHPTVLITNGWFQRQEEQQRSESNKRVNFFLVLQNSPLSELQIVFTELSFTTDDLTVASELEY